MKRLGKKKGGDISPDLTSFSDIANLLIIFFILTTSLVRPFGRQMDMPSSAKQQDQSKPADTPTVNVTAERITLADGKKDPKELTMNELRAELFRRRFDLKDEKNRCVVLETADNVTYERYYQVVTAIAGAGGVVAVMED